MHQLPHLESYAFQRPNLSHCAGAVEGPAQQMSPSPSMHRRVHSEPVLDYSLLVDASSTPRNGDRQVPLRHTHYPTSKVLTCPGPGAVF